MSFIRFSWPCDRAEFSTWSWRHGPEGRLLHATSSDGAATFSKPAPITDDKTAGVGEFPALAATPGGLVAAWTDGDRVSTSVLLDSGKWGAVRPVTGPSPGVRLSHPAAAATAGAVWVLAYRWEDDPSKVDVVLYRSVDKGQSWVEHCVVASRKRTAGRGRTIPPGDYIGLAAARETLTAAYVLAGGGKEGPKPRLYVARVGVSTK